MKILEAWARGVPVVATTAAAAGLEDGDGPALLQEDAAAELASTFESLAHDPDLRESLEREGRRILALRHDPAKIGARWLELYRETSSGPVAAPQPRGHFQGT
jgi:glycosyltransferase involved in cell wall biosynthesis